jgi:hypothetical protein
VGFQDDFQDNSMIQGKSKGIWFCCITDIPLESGR